LKFRSLKTRILIWFASVVLVLLVLFSIAFYYFFNQSINISIQSKLYKEALSIKEKIESNMAIDKILAIQSLSYLHMAIIKNGEIVNKTTQFKLQNINKYIKKNTSFFTFDNGETIKAIVKLKFKKPFDGTIVLIEDDIDDKAENLVDTMLFLNPVLLLLMIFFASRLIDKILIPIKDITKTAQTIDIDKLSNQIEQPKYNDELKELIDSFNAMIIRLQSGFEQIERFNSDVSHELKTPLTVIKGEAKLSLRKAREPQEYRQSIKIIAEEANSMQKMIDDLLLLVQYSNENIEQSFSLIDMDTLLIMVLEKYDAIAKEKGIKIHLDKLEPISYHANGQLIAIIFSNIIDNAIKYTPENKNIHISLFKDEKIYFIVRDEGIGIPQEKLNKITNRFYRVDESRNKEIEGFGLGLSIVKNSVNLHHAQIDISSQLNIGTIVKITF